MEKRIPTKEPIRAFSPWHDDRMDSLKVEAEKAAAFLDLLAEHLEGSEMPGKAGDCTVVARRLRAAAKRL